MQKSLKRFNILSLQIAYKIFIPVRRPLRIQKLFIFNKILKRVKTRVKTIPKYPTA